MPSHDQKEKKSAADLRKELRELRKEKVKPVSRMRVGDISAEIEKLRGAREETPAVASMPSAPMKKSKAAVETIKEAKAKEFPVAPASASEKPARADKKAPVAEPKKKNSKLAKLMKLMESFSDTEED